MAPAIESVNEQLRALGVALPHPRKADRVREKKHKQRASIGAPVRRMLLTEEGWYPAFEALLGLHGCTFFHPTTNHLTRKRAGQKGWVDYTILGHGWHAFCELKARNPETGRAGKLDPDQERYRDEIIEADGEWRSFLLPDEWDAVEDWLTSHTGKVYRGTWRTA